MTKLKAVPIYGKSREKRPRRRRKQIFVFCCEICGNELKWHIPRKEGVFCEKCWEAKINKGSD